MKTSNAAARVQANLPDLFRANLASGEAYIRFQLTKDLPALLSMKQVQGSIIVPADKITPLPGMPKSVIGITSYRDRVFCVFDLAQLLGFPTKLFAPQQYQVIILESTTKQLIYLGFAVTRLQSIVPLKTEEILFSLDTFPSKICSHFSGAVREEKMIIPILNFPKILATLDNLANRN